MTDTPKAEDGPPPIVRTAYDPETDAPPPEEDADWELYDAQEKAKALRALFSNRVFVQPDGLHLRISFGERVGDETVYHTAMVIPHGEALEFGRLLMNMATASLEQQWTNVRNALGVEQPQEPEASAGG
jgi:hypothetical protein